VTGRRLIEILMGEFTLHEDKHKLRFKGKAKSPNGEDINNVYDIYIIDKPDHIITKKK
jgi:hypothetical protein